MNEKKVSVTLRVRYCETDQMGVVHHGNYFAWFEIARSEYCRELNMPYPKWEEQGVFLPVVDASCRYKRPAHYDEEITVECVIKELGKLSVTFAYEIRLDGALLAEGQTKHAFCDKNGKLIKKDNPFIELLK